MTKLSIQTWIIRTEEQGTSDPLTKEDISKKIKNGILTGEDEIAIYPDGDWIVLSKVIDFYEDLIAAIESPMDFKNEKDGKMAAETIVQGGQKPKHLSGRTQLIENDKNNKSKIGSTTEIRKGFQSLVKIARDKKKEIPSAIALKNESAGKKLKEKLFLTPQSDANSYKTKSTYAKPSETLELSSIKSLKNNETKKLWPIFVSAILVLVGGLLYLTPDKEKKRNGWSLIIPIRGQVSLSIDDNKRLKINALSKIRTGDIEDLLEAQIQLVTIAEKGPIDLEAISILCSVQYLLWPYTTQSPNDLKAVSLTVQIIRSANPISSYSDACQAMHLWVKGQPRDARGLLEKTLDQELENRFVVLPFLYVMKADMLEDSQNYMSAEAYFRAANRAFPEWLWPQFGIGRTLYKQKKYNDARTLFDGMLKLRPNSNAALYGYALTEALEKKDQEKAYQFFTNGYALNRKLPRSFRVDALIEFTKILIAKGDREKALQVVEKGLEISPSNHTLREFLLTLGGQDKALGKNGAAELVMLGDQFVRNDDHLAAQAQYKAGFDLDQSNAIIPLKIAKSLWQLNQAREAQVWLDKAIKIDAKFHQAYALKADYYSQKYNFIEANQILLEASRREPNNFEILKAQALVEFRKQNLNGASVFAERAMKLYDSDVELLSLLANININIIINMPSRTADEQERLAKAVELGRKYSGKAVDLEPGWPEAQLTYARFILADQGSVKSENYIKELIKNFPYSVDYRLGLAEFYEKQEKYRSAIDSYLLLVSSDQKSKRANLGLARSYRAVNDYQKAQKYFLEAAVIDPSDVEPLFQTAQLQLDTASGHTLETTIKLALAKFKTVKEINPNYPKVSYFLARANMYLGHFDEAIALIKEEKQKNPNIAEPYLLAAEIYEKKMQFKDCAAEYSLALKLRSQSADLFVRTASCYRRADMVDIAQDMVDMAVQRERGYPTIYREQALISEKKGLRREAKKAFELYLELSPNAIDRKEIQGRIKNLE